MKATTLLENLILNLHDKDWCQGKLTILILQRLQGLGFQEDEENFSKVHRRDEKRMNIKVVDMFDNFVISSVWNLIFRWNTVWAINKINCFVAMTNKKISLIFVTCKLSPCRLKLLGRTLKSNLSRMPNFCVKTFYQLLLIIRPSSRLLWDDSWERSFGLSLAWPQIWPRIYGAGSERKQGMRCSWCSMKDRSRSPSGKGVFSHLEATQCEWTEFD